MSVTFQDLPLEILRKIASSVEDKATLSSASMIGTRLARHAFQEQLFELIDIYSFDRPRYNLDSLVYSQDTETRDRLTSHISAICIYRFLYPWNTRSLAVVIPVEAAVTLSLLPKLTTLYLVHATFQWDELNVEQTRNVVALFTLPTLTQLTDISLRGMCFPLYLLPFCPNLQVLELRHTSADLRSWIMRERDPPNLVKQLTGLHLPSAPVVLQRLELSGLELIFYFTTFSEKHRDMRCTEVDLHYLDGLSPDSQGMIPSEVVGRFIRSAGSSIETLRLHVTRGHEIRGSTIPADDLSSLDRLTSLEVTLTNTLIGPRPNIAHFLETLLIPLLESASHLKEMKRLSIRYELQISDRDWLPDLSTLSTTWGTLDHILTRRPALKELVCCLHVEVRRLTQFWPIHGPQCLDHGMAQEIPPGEDLLRHFPALMKHGIQVHTAISYDNFISLTDYPASG